MAVRFDAANDRYIDTAGVPAARIWTALCWVYLTTDRNDYSNAFAISDGTNYLSAGFGAGGTVRYVGWEGGDLPANVAPTDSAAGTWARLAVVCNGTSVTLYWGDATGALLSRTGTGIPATTPTTLYIGSDQFGSWLNGRVAGFKLWQAALTAAEVEAELSQYAPRRTANLLRFHPFVVAGLTDYSGQGNDLTAGSSAAATEEGPPIPWTSRGARIIRQGPTDVTVELGAAVETSAARAMAAGKTTALGAASTSDSARAIAAGDKAAALGQATSAETARPLVASKVATLGSAATADTARSLVGTKAVELGVAAETSTALPVLEQRGLGTAVETDTARPLGAEKIYVLGGGSETDTARALDPVKAAELGAGAETNAARAIAAADKSAALGAAATTDAARPVEFGRLHPIGQAAETSAARPIGHELSWALGRVTVTETGRPLASSKLDVVGRATTADTARSITVTRSYQLGRATETSTARALKARQATAGALNLSLWAVDRAHGGKLVPLPHRTKLALSDIENAAGALTVDYPAYGANFELLRANVTKTRDLEVEVWLGGRASTAMRGYLSQKQGDDVAEASVWSFTGSLMPLRLAQTLIYPQADDEKKELRFTARTPGQIGITLLSQAQARGALTDITIDFTATHDSDGVAWPTDEKVSGKWSPKTTYLQLLSKLVDLGVLEFEITAAKVWRMYVFGGRGANRTSGTGKVVFRRGVNVTEASRRESSLEAGTDVLVDGSEGLYATAENTEALADRGRRVEVAGSAGNIEDQSSLNAYATKVAAAGGAGVDERTYGLAFGAGMPRPGVSFGVGDMTLADTDGVLDSQRVAQWQLSEDMSGVSGSAVVGDLIADRQAALFRRLNEQQSGGVIVGTSEPPPVDDAVAPSAPDGVIVNSDYYPGADAIPLASVQVGWDPVTTNEDATPCTDLQGYRVRHRVVAGAGGLPGPWLVHPDITGTSFEFADVDGGVQIDVSVQAFDRTGNESTWSDPPVRITTETDTTAPPTPSTPSVTPYLGQLRVAWDGLSSVSGPMPLDLVRVEVHVSTGAAFTPSSSTLRDEFRYIAGERIITDLPYGVTYYVRLVAVDRSNNVSSPSAVGSAVPAKVVGDDVFDGAIGSAKLADLAVTTAKINLLAVNDAQIGALSVGKLTAGTISVAVLNSGIIRTNTTGQRTEQDAASFRVYSATALTVELNGASNLISGTIKTALSGKRWELLPDTTMRFYHLGGDYSQFTSYDSYDGSAVMWRAPLDGSGFSGRLSVTTIGVNLSVSAETDLTHLRSEILLRKQDVMITSPLIQFKASRQYAVNPGFGGSQRIVLMFKDSSGVDIADSTLYFQTAPSDQPWLAAPFTNSGIAFDTNQLVCQNGARAAIPIVASAFTVSSSRAAKFDEAELPFGPLAIVNGAPEKSWRYRSDAAPRADRPDVPPGVLDDPDAVVEWRHPQLPAPLHFGPMAEDLQALHPALVTDVRGELGTDVRDLVGVLWGAVRELSTQVNELKGAA